jgi:chromatin remodeling complex protein RSC6
MSPSSSFVRIDNAGRCGSPFGEIGHFGRCEIEGRQMARTATKRGKDETKAAEKKVEKTGKPAGGARGGITAPVTPSPELAEIVGDKDLPRSEVVSKVWEYIKKHDLQDAKDRRQINADDKLEKVFGKKSASMFEMNKHLSRHLTAKKAD